MGRTLLICAAVLLAACDVGRAPNPAVATADPHEDITCTACHRGEKADQGRASVPREACAASGCHEEGGPPSVTLATATFEHRNHAADSDITVNCAGCHTHDKGEEPLRASVDACALCHTKNLAGKTAEECQLCHVKPQHVTLTSQGVAVAHSSLPWLETGCARCHYDVLQPQQKVALVKCASCHKAGDELTKEAIAKDLHPGHRGITCTSCHQPGLHQVTEMSSAVTLNCADCHTRDHDVPTDVVTQRACGACHRDAHSAQQRMVLGIVGDGRIMPSSKFMIGATCRSCHAPPGARTASDAPRRGQAAACVGCHEREYDRVLTWWVEGVRTRERIARAYVVTARNALAQAPDSSEELLTRAFDGLDLVRSAGGQHNLELADLIFRESVGFASDAYRVAGKTAPAQPDFGNTPHVGTCSFCHYGSSEQWNYKAVPRGLHERLIKTSSK